MKRVGATLPLALTSTSARLLPRVFLGRPGMFLRTHCRKRTALAMPCLVHMFPRRGTSRSSPSSCSRNHCGAAAAGAALTLRNCSMSLLEATLARITRRSCLHRTSHFLLWLP
jgi:hypothetical protein